MGQSHEKLKMEVESVEGKKWWSTKRGKKKSLKGHFEIGLRNGTYCRLD